MKNSEKIRILAELLTSNEDAIHIITKRRIISKDDYDDISIKGMVEKEMRVMNFNEKDLDANNVMQQEVFISPDHKDIKFENTLYVVEPKIVKLFEEACRKADEGELHDGDGLELMCMGHRIGEGEVVMVVDEDRAGCRFRLNGDSRKFNGNIRKRTEFGDYDITECDIRFPQGTVCYRLKKDAPQSEKNKKEPDSGEQHTHNEEPKRNKCDFNEQENTLVNEVCGVVKHMDKLAAMKDNDINVEALVNDCLKKIRMKTSVMTIEILEMTLKLKQAKDPDEKEKLNTQLTENITTVEGMIDEMRALELFNDVFLSEIVFGNEKKQNNNKEE